MTGSWPMWLFRGGASRVLASLWLGCGAPALADEPAVGSLQLEVTDSNALPLPSARVELALPDGTVSRLTDPQGRAVLTVPAGTWTVDVTKSGFTGQMLTNVVVAPGEQAVIPVALDDGPSVSEIADRAAPKSHTPDLPARGGTTVVAYAEAKRWSRAVLKCDGYGTYLERSIVGGVARFDGIPRGVACRVRVSGGSPPAVAEFTGGAPRVQVVAP